MASEPIYRVAVHLNENEAPSGSNALALNPETAHIKGKTAPPGHSNPAYLTDPDDTTHHLTRSSSKQVLEDEVEGCDDDSSDEEDHSIFSLLPGSQNIQAQVKGLAKYQGMILFMTLAAAYVAYFYAVLAIETDTEKGLYWCDSDGLLIILTGLLLLALTYFQIIKKFYGKVLLRTVVEPVDSFVQENILARRWVPWAIFAVLVVGALAFLGVDARDDLRRLQSLIGIVVILLFGFVFSIAPRKVRWRHVAWGMALQFILGLIILRWDFGRAVFKCAADKVATFIAFTDEGSIFVFGELASDLQIFAFTVLPVTIFFSFCVQILYYWGVMQWVVLKLGWLLQVTIGTTTCESVNAAGNIFLGMTEAPLMIRPYIAHMTKSELHAVMTGGLATIAGSVLAAYISFGVDAVHLLSASVMSAPAALAFSKLYYPETRKSKITAKDIKVTRGDQANVLHAAMVGVINAIPLVANIAANLIAFNAFIALLSHVFDWTCTLAGAEEGVCTLENLFGWIFMPLAWVMGVDWSECDEVGELIGIKTILNEFVAYSRLAEMLEAGELSKRAEIIATYALCGFSNIGSVGIILGEFGAIAPTRRGDIARIAVRSLIAGSCACFLTACIAGTLLSDLPDESATAAVAVTRHSRFIYHPFRPTSFT